MKLISRNRTLEDKVEKEYRTVVDTLRQYLELTPLPLKGHTYVSYSPRKFPLKEKDLKRESLTLDKKKITEKALRNYEERFEMSIQKERNKLVIELVGDGDIHEELLDNWGDTDDLPYQTGNFSTKSCYRPPLRITYTRGLFGHKMKIESRFGLHGAFTESEIDMLKNIKRGLRTIYAKELLK